METPGVSVDPTSSDNHASSSSNPSSPFPIIRFLQAPVTTLIEHFGVLRYRANNNSQESESLFANHRLQDHSFSGSGTASNSSRNGGEVLIRISSGGGQEREHGEQTPLNRADSGDVRGGNGWQQVPRWIEQMVTFFLLLLIVFVRQHLQVRCKKFGNASESFILCNHQRACGPAVPMYVDKGLFLTVYITAFIYKSNDILRKQTALKGERKLNVLAGYCILFMLHVTGVYWWYQNDDLCNPLFLLPPKAIPSFWNAIFIIIVNDTMVRQAAMAFKLVLLMYYKNGRGKSFRRQGQILTLIEYALLLYRAFLPAPVWYRFFLNKEYGSLFSSLTTGLYLTLKLTSVVEKIGSFYAALKALSRKEVNYGSHATAEQVSQAGDVCAICQEKMQAPILLCCKHIFCEDCVSEWFERERSCPLCRALVRPADIRLFGDGSTSLLFQLF